MKRLYWLALILSLLLIAFMESAHWGYAGLSLDTKIRPIEAAALFVNIFIAIFLQYFLAGQARDLRAEKDILIDSIKDIIEHARNCRDLLDSFSANEHLTSDQRSQVLLLLRQLSNELNDFTSIVKESSCENLAEDCNILQNVHYRAYKQAATGGNFPQHYSKIQLKDQEKSFRALHVALQSLAFKINKHV